MDFSKLDTYMEQMTLRGVPACELSVTKDGECIYRKCVGFSDVEGKKPVTPHPVSHDAKRHLQGEGAEIVHKGKLCPLRQCGKPAQKQPCAAKVNGEMPQGVDGQGLFHSLTS